MLSDILEAYCPVPKKDRMLYDIIEAFNDYEMDIKTRKMEREYMYRERIKFMRTFEAFLNDCD